jgi:mevalonate kinase
MAQLLGETSIHGAVPLFGEFNHLIGEPAMALMIDLKVNLKIKTAEFDFNVVDGFKLETNKHFCFDRALKRFWPYKKQPLEFITSSEIPMVSGLGTGSALVVALTGLLLEIIKKKKAKDVEKKKQHSAQYLARQAYELETEIEPYMSPLGTSTSIAGGAVLMMDIPASSLWSIPSKTRSWFMHHISTPEEMPLVIGFLKDQTTTNNSPEEPKPLFDKPMKADQLKNMKISSYSVGTVGKSVSTLEKLQRSVGQKSFGKDIIRGLAKNTRAAVDAMTEGDLNEVGRLMSEQLNLLRIMGAFPEEMRPLVDAAIPQSDGVTIIGAYGDALVATTNHQEKVIEKIEKAGGIAFKAEMVNEGFAHERGLAAVGKEKKEYIYREIL